MDKRWRIRDEVFRINVFHLSKQKWFRDILRLLNLSYVGTLTRVEGNINSDKNIRIVAIDNNLCLVIARHCKDDNYLFQDDNSQLDRSRVTKDAMEDNCISTMN